MQQHRTKTNTRHTHATLLANFSFDKTYYVVIAFFSSDYGLIVNSTRQHQNMAAVEMPPSLDCLN